MSNWYKSIQSLVDVSEMMMYTPTGKAREACYIGKLYGGPGWHIHRFKEPAWHDLNTTDVTEAKRIAETMYELEN